MTWCQKKPTVFFYQRRLNDWSNKSVNVLPNRKKQITKRHALQVKVVVETHKYRQTTLGGLSVFVCVCVVCVVLCCVPRCAVGPLSGLCGGLVVSLNDTHEADTLGHN